MIDLDELRRWHPGLPDWYAAALMGCAAIALQRRHAPGVALLLRVAGEAMDEALTWQPRSGAKMVDAKRVTEDGAEGVALAIMGRYRRGWRLVRRLQSGKGEGADWLVHDGASGRNVVLEISGTDEEPFAPRVRQKREQAALAVRRGTTPAVSVVRFLEPQAMLEG